MSEPNEEVDMVTFLRQENAELRAKLETAQLAWDSLVDYSEAAKEDLRESLRLWKLVAHNIQMELDAARQMELDAAQRRK